MVQVLAYGASAGIWCKCWHMVQVLPHRPRPVQLSPLATRFHTPAHLVELLVAAEQLQQVELQAHAVRGAHNLEAGHGQAVGLLRARV